MIYDHWNIISLKNSTSVTSFCRLTKAKYNVQYSATADWPTLGKKLKKDALKVKKALPSLSSDDVKKLVKRGLPGDEASKGMETNIDNDVLIILDANLYPELAREGLAREIVNLVQRLRKAGLVPTDDVKMEYRVLSDPDDVAMAEVFNSQANSIEKALRRPVDKHIVTEIEGKIPDVEEEGFSF